MLIRFRPRQPAIGPCKTSFSENARASQSALSFEIHRKLWFRTADTTDRHAQRNLMKSVDAFHVARVNLAARHAPVTAEARRCRSRRSPSGWWPRRLVVATRLRSPPTTDLPSQPSFTVARRSARWSGQTDPEARCCARPRLQRLHCHQAPNFRSANSR